MSEFSDLAGRKDWSTPLPWHGTPYVKTYFDWTHYIWRTEVCILLGTRQEAPGKPWSDRAENAGKGRPPGSHRHDLSPQGQRQAAHGGKARHGPRSNNAGLRSRIRAYLARHIDASTSEVHKAIPECSLDSVRISLWNDPQVECLGGGRKGKESRWRLRPEAVAHE